ncbi:hypothetical protein HDU99_006222 [Rhizoclosmatium hyalinum]|nr:hypothetical protein HDU99_006222 [Rhizoclosmatium hyalinum]
MAAQLRAEHRVRIQESQESGSPSILMEPTAVTTQRDDNGNEEEEQFYDAETEWPDMDEMADARDVDNHEQHNIPPNPFASSLPDTISGAFIEAAVPQASKYAKRRVDGFKSAKHFNTENGGGGNYGFFKWASSFFSSPIVDYVEAAKTQGRSVTVEQGCESDFAAGLETGQTGKDSVTDIGMIFHMDCRHDIVMRIMDADEEKMVYADTCVDWLLKTFPGRAVVFGYDVVCKWWRHAEAYALTLPFMLFIPALHVYAHGVGCQCRFGPHTVMGLGFSLNGEGVERSNSRLSKSIALTIREMIENRQLDISLVFEDYNFCKVRSLVHWTRKTLEKAIAQLEALLGSGIVHTNLPSYRSVVVSNKRGLKIISERVSRIRTESEADRRHVSQVKLENTMRVIMSIEQKLGTKIGTARAGQMKMTLAKLIRTRSVDLAKHNELFPEHKLDVKALRENLVIKTDDASQTQYWRYLEDIYHHRGHLRNLIAFYLERKETFWKEVEFEVSQMGNKMFQSAASQLSARVMKRELDYSSQAQGVLDELLVGVRAELLFDESLFDQIQDAFDDGTLSNQHLLHLQ